MTHSSRKEKWPRVQQTTERPARRQTEPTVPAEVQDFYRDPDRIREAVREMVKAEKERIRNGEQVEGSDHILY